jgi:DedD protein
MPAPASEDDLKRRARRRLIGAVALTLVAVIALPLLLEDEPPPSGRLAVNMPPIETPAPAPAASAPEPEAAAPAETDSAPPEETESDAPAERAAKPAEVRPVTAHDSRASGFVVQLGAFSNAEKGSALKARAIMLGLPGYTDTAGALTRVRVGPFATHEAAAKAATTLAAGGMKGQVVAK